MERYKKLRDKEWRIILKASLIIGSISALLNIWVNLRSSEVTYYIILMGGLISFFLGFFNPFFLMSIEFFVLNQKKARSLPFHSLLLLRIIIYIFIGSILYIIIGLLFFPGELLNIGSILFTLFSILFFSLTISVINFFRNFLGPGFFKSYLISKYHQAKIQSAIFLFIDLKGSTSLAEETTPQVFFQYLNDFIYLCEEVIKVHEGKIYKYVGDSIIVVWDEKRENLQNSYQCMKELVHHIHRNRAYFLKTYQRDLSFTLGIHRGPTTIGEIGYEKKEIGYLSDTINTAQRIQDYNRVLGTEYLLSKEYLHTLREHGLAKESEDSFVKYPSISLKGKDRTIDLYAYRKK